MASPLKRTKILSVHNRKTALKYTPRTFFNQPLLRISPLPIYLPIWATPCQVTPKFALAPASGSQLGELAMHRPTGAVIMSIVQLDATVAKSSTGMMAASYELSAPTASPLRLPIEWHSHRSLPSGILDSMLEGVIVAILAWEAPSAPPYLPRRLFANSNLSLL